MQKMFALKTILRHVDDAEQIVNPGAVFDAEPMQARQLMDLDSARTAFADEIKAHERAQAQASGVPYKDAVHTKNG